MSYDKCFTKQAAAYRKFRPTYPQSLFDFLTAQSKHRDLVWDVGTGNGQAARALVKTFSKVIATDVAEAQIKEAVPEANITFVVAPAEKAPLDDRSADLVTVAQAIHWFELETFYREVRRVLKPGGLVAAWSYNFSSLEDKTLHKIIDDYGRIFLGPYWSSRLKVVHDDYRSLPFPFTPVEAPRLTLSFDWSYEQLKGYFDSWSVTQSYKDANGGKDPFETIRGDVKKAWGNLERKVAVVWPMTLKVGRLE